MARHIELALNDFVANYHQRRETLSEEPVKHFLLTTKARDVLGRHGKESQRGSIRYPQSGAVIPKMETDPVVVRIPFSTDDVRGQDVSLTLSDATEKGVYSGTILEVSVPTASDVLTMFYFRSDPKLAELGDVGSQVKNSEGTVATMHELVIAGQLLTYMDEELARINYRKSIASLDR